MAVDAAATPTARLVMAPASINAARSSVICDFGLSDAGPLHLAVTFGLSPGTAVCYASSARSLLQTAAEQQDPAEFPANPATRPAQES
ncbi:MAG: hypothetical protein ABSF03_25730 [Streptosporangiaceae bacterium]|jgi:hypothetical protein